MLSNDTRLPPYVPEGSSGPWTKLYPIKILNPNSFTEAVWWLTFRDLDHANSYDNTWIGMIPPLMEIHENPHRSIKRTLRPKFQAIIRRVWLPALELMQEMRDNNELPPLPPSNWYGTVEAAQRARRWI
ncbi:uncharacterized protein N7518_005838 [Penicillium psychrosexuale]|uniref:uncharacterized protein n=1 Tax=Penicillium psychrosexuale TaxID=1002107 RepID=UPI00254574A7|nr:uncharacterized protein N7518_005838 [Penicillium psychrosexuale]KAJ5788827.1 hypothetical protein N7518_005838 [Penicillium psychrosexuale]